jgi:hypothetical protein
MEHIRVRKMMCDETVQNSLNSPNDLISKILMFLKSLSNIISMLLESLSKIISMLLESLSKIISMLLN